MKRIILLLSTFFLFLAACSNSGENADRQSLTSQEVVSDDPIDEDQVLLQLTSYLIAEPENQAEQDQNDLVDYAINKLVPLQRTPSGLLYRILEAGSGDPLQWGDYISTHYKGYFLDEQIFDDSRRRNKPLQFYIGNMIPGWNEGLQMIAPGGRIQLFVPSSLGYGEEGLPNSKGGLLVPANTPLIFEVEVLEKLKSAGEE